MWGRCGEEGLSTVKTPAPARHGHQGKKGIDWREKGTTGGWYLPACWSWAAEKDGLSWCPVLNHLHLPSSLKEGAQVGPLMSR